MKKGQFYPKGIAIINDEVQFVFKIEKKAKKVEIGIWAGEEELQRFTVPEKCRQGQLYSVILRLPEEADGYCYYADGELAVDEYAGAVIGMRNYGEEKTDVRYAILRKEYDWEEDKFPLHSYAETVIYGLHVRGFTKHTSSAVRKKGTFAGVREKIPYLKDLGITAIELMPAYEFDETEKTDEKFQKESETKINYWGFKRGSYYAPKSAYAYDADAVTEMKDMVKALHKAGIEVVMQFYFPEDFNQSEIADVLQFWVTEYHIDGFHLMGENVPLAVLGTEPLLRETKLIGNYFPTDEGCRKKEADFQKNLALWKTEFLYSMRKALKGDEGCVPLMISNLQDNPQTIGVINAIASYEGFTLNDLVAYDRKHNEENGEENKDGNDYNCSWNCGTEGKTRKKSILQLRRRQMRNGMALVFLAQGTPYIQSGDEFAQTQGGNNNPYCQDNAVTWIDWKLLKANRDFYEYTKNLIAFRKKHVVFHREQQLKGLDYLGCGCPDISFHGEEAWRPVFENYSRCVGVMYSGKYAKNQGRCEDSDFYVALNMHWEPHELALPKLPKEMEWRICMDTMTPEGFLRLAEEETIQVESVLSGSILAEERSIVICQAVKKKRNQEEK